MKIKRLWVSKYKNLENLNLDFNSSHFITLLVGQNGLGKSNVIEILALIFRDLASLDDYEEFVKWPSLETQFEFEIEFLCKGRNIKIECLENGFSIFEKDDPAEEEYKTVEFEEFIKRRKNEYLPTYIVSYYSGENDRIRRIVKKYEENEKDRLSYYFGNLDIEDDMSTAEKSQVKPSVGDFRYLFYAENHHSQLLLLTLALFQNSAVYGEKIQELLQDYLRIEKIEEFEIRFKSPITYPEDHEPSENERTVDYLISNILKEVSNPFWGLPDKIDDLLTLFYNHMTGRGISPIGYQENEEVDPIEESIEIREYLDFNEIDFDSFYVGLDENQKHPLDFFDALETADIIEILDEITFKVKRKGVKDLIELTDLSEGEQQFLSVIGLLLVTSRGDSLYLLDEPDTHLNPNWQRDYVDVLKAFNLNPSNSHIFVATHSPLIVQSSKDSDVVLFYEEEPGNVIAEVSEIQFHRWRTDHVLTSKYFGLESARPKDEELDQFMARRKEILEKEDITPEDKAFLESSIDEGGLLPSGETFNDLVAMQYIRIAAKKLRRNG